MKYLFVRLKNWFMYDLKLRSKFFIVYFVCTIIPFILLSIYTCSITSSRLNAHTQESISALLSQTKDFINYRLESVIETVNTVYLDTALYNYLSETSEQTGYNEDLIESKLSTLSGEREVQNVNLYLLDESKIPRNNYRCLSVESAKTAPWYGYLQKDESLPVWLYSSEGHSIYYAKKIFSKYDSDQLVGYIAATINQSVLTDLLDDLSYTAGSIACVVDENSGMVISRGQTTEGLEQTLWEVNLSSDIDLQYIKLNDSRYCASQTALSFYSLSSLPQWHIVLLAPYDELFASGKILIRNMLLAAILSILVLNMIAARIIGNITRRIGRLIENMKQGKPDHFMTGEQTLGRDEIDALQKNFNRMMIRMDQLFQQSIQAKEKARESELNLLQNQINPHFLYNTLDLINWAACKVGSQEISEITFMLAKFYRLSLRKGVRIVSLVDELKHIELYVGLQNKRFKDAITLLIDVPQEHAACAALKLMLQPIVENSVLHGILEKDEPSGTIHIFTRRHGNEIDIVIEDDGVGIPADILDALNRGSVGSTESGVGIANTINRIQNCFGSAYGIRFEYSPGSFTRARITIPFVPYRDDMCRLNQIKSQ